jgi:hypothetical protein
MSELRATDRSLFVRNDTPLMWTLHDKTAIGRVDIELKPGEITYLRPSDLDAPGIARNKALGKITVSPDLEDEMVEKMSGGASASKRLLDQYQINVEQSAGARAIDVKERFTELERNGRPGGIVPQAGQRTSTVDEFNSPQPFKTDDGRWFDPQTATFIDRPGTAGPAPAEDTGIASVTITRPQRLPDTQ